MTWSAHLLFYPFLFVAIYFETFLLVTFLSRGARVKRKALHTETRITPSVAIIVPCYNEEKTIAATIRSLLSLRYPREKLSLILVDDGSQDATPHIMQSFASHPSVTVIRKENGGKYSALNAGIHAAPHAEIIGCLDADSFVDPDALKEIIPLFSTPTVMAVTAAMAVHEPHSLFERVQHAEYIFGIAVRHILSVINGLYVTPGPFSLYRRSVFSQLGDFAPGYQTEDMEMALRMQRAGMLIENAPRARVYTKAPSTLRGLIKQRTRWTSGFLRNVLFEYHDLIARPKYGALGMLVLPIALFSFVSGIFLFGLSLFLVGQHIVQALSVTSGVPLAYTLTPHFHWSWFYLPISGITLLSAALVLITVTFMVVGKRMARLPHPLGVNIIAYLLFYGFVSPLWLIRAVVDTVTKTERAWR